MKVFKGTVYMTDRRNNLRVKRDDNGPDVILTGSNRDPRGLAMGRRVGISNLQPPTMPGVVFSSNFWPLAEPCKAPKALRTTPFGDTPGLAAKLESQLDPALRLGHKVAILYDPADDPPSPFICTARKFRDIALANAQISRWFSNDALYPVRSGPNGHCFIFTLPTGFKLTIAHREGMEFVSVEGLVYQPAGGAKQIEEKALQFCMERMHRPAPHEAL